MTKISALRAAQVNRHQKPLIHPSPLENAIQCIFRISRNAVDRLAPERRRRRAHNHHIERQSRSSEPPSSNEPQEISQDTRGHVQSQNFLISDNPGQKKDSADLSTSSGSKQVKDISLFKRV
ncbi:hypothetical protein HYALB_00010460 [Hymenoscyphus albidus]|uniref:Uncharacterized protein n=1 Tax=Hymenoscyphus albidus TaxID=595503 RepID=A0A9N9Q3Y6_9HELO|nr:hypothetical protein HYALB_00010460 [Hymenoscyphus albidus]